MTITDAGLGFWLRYVEASGGLTEFSGDATLVVLPADLQTLLDLPETLRVTADPDIAREDGATLLSAGHPTLGRSADEILALGDVAAVVVPVAATTPPSAEHLQALAREQLSVDHGRVDAAGAPTRSVRTILRVGALVDYTLSTDDHYQECVECWIDVQSLRGLPAHVTTRLAALPTKPIDESPSLVDLTGALTVADQVIERCAAQRRSELGDDIEKARDAELGRVEVYYRDALATIQRRRAQAPADRQQLLDARAAGVRSEHARRIDETRQKYQASHEVRPYRLHLYDVPVWRLPVDVRRGDRRYPLTLDWLIPLTRFADVGCPHCGADNRLIATKSRLGCTGCVPRPTVQLAPEPPGPKPKQAKSRSEPTANTKPVVTQLQTPKRPPPPVCTEPSLTPAQLGKVGDKLPAKLWDAVACNDRRLARICTPDSPAAAAIRLYGPSGVAWAVGIPPTEDLVSFAAHTTMAASGARHASSGYVETAAGHRYPFQLRWQASGRTGQIDEILPYDWPVEPAYLNQWVLGLGRNIVYSPPQPRVPLGPVGELLWRSVVPRFGLSAILRCLAALWRLPDENIPLDSHGPAIVAAAIERMVCQRASLTSGRFADVAVAYRVKDAAVRAAHADLQKSLRLGSEKWW
jgi:hypothetical protein